MFRELTLSALLCASTGVLAESVDEVLKSKDNTVSEEQLDETAAKLVKEDAPKEISAGAALEKTTAPAITIPAAPSKPLNEDQIPVLKDEKTVKSSASGNWYRLIGSAAFVLLVTGGLIVVVKKSAKARNVGGKKAKIEIIHQHFLGPKKSVALIQVAGEAILIGITDNNINMIKPVALIDDEVPPETQDFNGFLEEDFTMEQLTAQKSRTRTV